MGFPQLLSNSPATTGHLPAGIRILTYNSFLTPKRLKMRPLAKIWVLPILSMLSFQVSTVLAQTYPEQSPSQSYIPPSPNSQAIASYGADPVALYNGTPAISLPVYTIKCGSLTVPITLSYNYNGLYPRMPVGSVLAGT
jgi:hypothetical protein